MAKARKNQLAVKRATDPSNPFKNLPVPEQGALPNYYGAFSIDHFPNAPELEFSHDDAGGWINYLSKYSFPNFWFKDELVTSQWYYEPTDFAAGTYGIDAVIAAYHSGHGGTVDNFYAAVMGAAEDDEPPFAFSNRMVLGNQRVNYIFWSTCESLLTNETQNPLTVWNLPDRGFRMLFGFNSTSLDDPNYGRYFWEEWQKGKSFSRAWLDAAWRISITMSPSAAAAGGTEDEALTRFSDERYFQAEHVAKNNWVWGWYQSVSAAPEVAASPGNLIELEPVAVDLSHFRRVAAQFQMGVRRPVRSPQGRLWVMKDGHATFSQEATGAYEYFVAPSQRQPISQGPAPTAEEARQIAADYIRQNGLGADLIPLCYRQFNIGSAADARENPSLSRAEQTVVFAQTIAGIPVVSNDAGQLTITVDASGQIIQVRDTRRAIKAVCQGNAGMVKQVSQTEIKDQLMAEASSQATTRWGNSNWGQPELDLIPESIVAGYLIDGDQAYFGMTAEVEANFPNNAKQRFKVTVPTGK